MDIETEYLMFTNQSLSSNNTNINSNSSLILPGTDGITINKLYFINIDVAAIDDWRLNILDINVKEKYIIIAVKNKVALIPFNYIKRSTKEILNLSRIKYILVLNETINQIKLMDNTYVLALDNAGYLHVKKIKYDYINHKCAEEEYKIFNCKINTIDNSAWSIDCYYPFVAVGGNHKSILVVNIEDSSSSEENVETLLLTGNKHNIPYVNFSPNGELLACNSIDSSPKVYDLVSGKMIASIINKTDQWGWGIKIIEKELFTINKTGQIINNEEYLRNTNHIFTDTVTINNLLKNLIFTVSTSLYDFISVERDNVFQINPAEEYNFPSINNYLYLSTYKSCLFLNSLCDSSTGPSSSSLGKIDLISNYFCNKYHNNSELAYPDVVSVKYYIEYSRYEYIHISKALNLLIIGNRQGDVQIYDMVINVYKQKKDPIIPLLDFEENEFIYKYIINNKPKIILDMNKRIAGMKLIDHIDHINPLNNFADLFILTVVGDFEAFRIKIN